MSISKASSVELGFLVGMVPTVAMTLSSIALATITVGPLVEACFQNFAAGLILAAVAAELFPLILDTPVQSDIWIGVTVGFAVGLSMIYGIESLIEYFEGMDSDEKGSDKGDNSLHDVQSKGEPKRMKTYPAGMEPGAMYLEMVTLSNKSASEDASETSSKVLLSPSGGMYGNNERFSPWEESAVDSALLAISAPQHKQHIHSHLHELMDNITLMEEKCQTLMRSDVSVREAEQVAEFIDEKVHSLQYQVDHCRRLLEGSESEALAQQGSSWVSEERKLTMQSRLRSLRSIVEHLLEHMGESETLDREVLKEMHDHMDDMDHHINFFHESVQKVGQRWTRKRELPATQIGDKVPYGLVVPVALDCFTDGFLIGVAVALSFHAGIILGAANCLEMSFLGMAYAARLFKCTGSSFVERCLALFVPPLIMFLASGLGAFLADAARSVPAVYVGFVAFGVVTLLFLVCNELLIEARSNQGDDEKWWVSILIFAGIYIVLMMGG